MGTVYHLLPSGDRTRSEQRHIREWRKVGMVVCNFLYRQSGDVWALTAFDPDLTIRRASDGKSCEIPKELAWAIYLEEIAFH